MVCVSYPYTPIHHFRRTFIFCPVVHGDSVLTLLSDALFCFKSNFHSVVFPIYSLCLLVSVQHALVQMQMSRMKTLFSQMVLLN